MYIAEGLEVGRLKAMRRAGTNRPIGSGYNKAFGEWLNPRPWARDLDKPTRTHQVRPAPSAHRIGVARRL